MFASPAKRRKTSPTASVAVDASNTASNPSTPKRASFQSPTKSSLARSHPNLLPQSTGRSQVQTRGQGLRQELLNQRTSQSAAKPSTTAPPTPRDESVGDKPPTAAANEPESFSGVVRNLFAAEPIELPVSVWTPLRTRQPPIRVGGSQTRYGDAQPLTQVHANRPRSRPRLTKDTDEDEPKLPPTPVQLGLNTQPDRPRGLSSSSPGRSSGSNRQRPRLGGSIHTSSPSKLRAQAEAMADPITSGRPPAFSIGRAEGIPDEAPESDAQGQTEVEESSASTALLQKRTLRASLSAQLARLQSDMVSLETALANSDKDNFGRGDANPSLLALLTTKNPSCSEVTPENHEPRSPSPPVFNPTALGPQPLPYLTLFAPGNLQVKSTTSTSVINNKAHQIHVLELLAPEPWPAHIFGATIRVAVNVEEKQVTKLELQTIRPGTGHQGLREWAKKRLVGGTSELHRYDVGGLVWGIGRWWEECVGRANEWRRLEEKLTDKKPERRRSSQKEEDDASSQAVITEQDTKTLLPHLARTSMEFDLGPARRVTRSTKQQQQQQQQHGSDTATPHLQQQQQPKVMLLWDLVLDWTGEVDATVGVAVAAGTAGAGGDKAEQGVKDVFGTIFKRAGVFVAMEGVLGVLGSGKGKVTELKG